MIPKIIHSYNQNNHVIRYFDGDDKITIFQSYNTIMFILHTHPATCILMDENDYNYTRTTCKYLYKFIDDFIIYDDDVSASVRNKLHDVLKSNNIKKSLLKYYRDEFRLW